MTWEQILRAEYERSLAPTTEARAGLGAAVRSDDYRLPIQQARGLAAQNLRHVYPDEARDLILDLNANRYR